mgnify:CR=1 FL=1
MKFLRGALCFLVGILVSSSCGYHLAGYRSTLPPHIRAISIPVFKNSSSEPNIQRDATDAMLKAMDECSTEGYDERLYAGHAASVYMAAWDAYDTPPPQRTWIGLEGAEAGWFCYTDFLNARKYTKKQRQLICCQLLSEAQSWDIGNYQLMMHDSTKIKENK